MKYLIFSDLHGSAKAAEFIANKFVDEKCDMMICLGDVLYHGPRNDLPEYYSPKQVIQILNPFADKIICIQGNCDAEVDQMVLNFKFYKSKNMLINGKKCHLEHGHHLDMYTNKPNVVLFGHTHISMLEFDAATLYLNPGSITISKNKTLESYILWDKNKITLFDIKDNILKEVSL